jgi:hypothetical protein
MLGTIACGGGRDLVGVSLNPSSADGQGFSGGQVRFTATGSFNRDPRTQQLTSSDIGWCIGTANGSCNGNIAAGATVDGNGVAQCSPGFQGTATVLSGKAKAARLNRIRAIPWPSLGRRNLLVLSPVRFLRRGGSEWTFSPLPANLSGWGAVPKW